MIKRLQGLCLVGCICIVIQGCTCRAWFDGLKEYQRQDCLKIDSQTERQACLDRVNGLTYDQYSKDRGDTDKQAARQQPAVE
jgi:hypothetical protein